VSVSDAHANIDTESEGDAPWRRLSPRMLLVHPVREMGRYIPALIGLFVAGRSIGDGQWWLGPLGVLGVISLSVMRWATTRYRITPEQVQLRTGLLQRKTVAAPADRVRSVDVTASALHRLLGLAKVEIGTGSHERESGLSLDSLPTAEAAALRAELLHRSAGTSMDQPFDGPLGVGAAGPRSAAPAVAAVDVELVRLDPGWVRFAPFTMSGVLSAAAILGVGWNLLNQLEVTPSDVGPVKGVLQHLEQTAIWLALAIFVTALSIGGYVLSYWGFRLTRHAHGSLHVTRGLLTTRATSIEERRLTGVELGEPLGLRAVHAARLSGITTGLRSSGRRDGGSSLLLPPAPVAVARDVASKVLGDASKVLGDSGAVVVTLVAHGAAARRRRYARALLPAFVLVTAAGVFVWAGAPPWIGLPALVTVPLAAVLAKDRYRSLGHALCDGALVTQQGSLSRRRDVLDCDGIIGWNVRQTFFQRRAGLATLIATTAAGRQQYAVTDVGLPVAVSLGNDALPGLLADFLAPD